MDISLRSLKLVLSFLDVKELLRSSVANQELQQSAKNSAELWEALCESYTKEKWTTKRGKVVEWPTRDGKSARESWRCFFLWCFFGTLFLLNRGIYNDIPMKSSFGELTTCDISFPVFFPQKVEDYVETLYTQFIFFKERDAFECSQCQKWTCKEEKALECEICMEVWCDSCADRGPDKTQVPCNECPDFSTSHCNECFVEGKTERCECSHSDSWHSCCGRHAFDCPKCDATLCDGCEQDHECDIWHVIESYFDHIQYLETFIFFHPCFDSPLRGVKRRVGRFQRVLKHWKRAEIPTEIPIDSDKNLDASAKRKPRVSFGEVFFGIFWFVKEQRRCAKWMGF